MKKEKKNSMYKIKHIKMNSKKQNKRCQGHLLKNKKNKIFDHPKKNLRSFIFLLILYFESLTSVLRLLIKIPLKQTKKEKRNDMQQFPCACQLLSKFSSQWPSGRIHFHSESKVLNMESNI
jgi:hypothetical protein